MNRRRKIRQQVQDFYRCAQHIGDKPPPPPIKPPIEDNPGARPNAGDTVRNPTPGSPRPGPTGGFVQNRPILQAVVRDSQGGLFSVRIFGGPNPEVEISSIPHDSFPIHLEALGPEGLADLLNQLGINLGHMEPRQIMDLSRQQLWVQIPQGEDAHAVMETVARMLNPNGVSQQDGLRSLFGSPQFQRLFQGGQLPQGATRMIPTSSWVSVMIPPSALAANPAAAKALLVAQGLPAGLIQSIPDKAVSGVLQSLLQTSQAAGQNPLQFFQSIASVLTMAGVPVQNVQDLLLGMLQGAQHAGLAGPLDQAGLQQMAGRLLALNNPQLLGLNQMVQSQFGQGLGQIFGAFIKVFFGGALMQGQAMWPQVVPNDKMLAELGGLFARSSQRSEDAQTRRRRRTRKGRIDKLEAEFPRVERKEHPTDEDSPHHGMESIFIESDE